MALSLYSHTVKSILWCVSVQDSCRDLLAVMLTPSSITIWNASTGTKVSRFTFTETIVAFVFNPFQPENLVRKSLESVEWEVWLNVLLCLQCSHQSVLSLSVISTQAAIPREGAKSSTSLRGSPHIPLYQAGGNPLLGSKGNCFPAIS